MIVIIKQSMYLAAQVAIVVDLVALLKLMRMKAKRISQRVTMKILKVMRIA